ncbi:hypothetical protein AB0B15_14355 [Streptomyces sp. NPDC045456]|uniref:hypothetical protein n=1 Tax=Streptomyces sp. NPDC045456 TaxID=3155254 RepID=UPI003406DA6C
MNLRAWIVQRVEAAEAVARAELIGREVVAYPHDGSRAASGTVTDVAQSAEGLELTLSGRESVTPDGPLVPMETEMAALRRCEADRRVLARHTLDTSQTAFPAACEGCGTDDWGLPNVENLNDCPELRDLAHAHGLTDEILTRLDRPEPPE